MMAQKHLLHELLTKDQEPFLLHNYIADRRSQLKRPPVPQTTLQSRKSKSFSRTSFCSAQACFFSYTDSPDFTHSSPFYDFSKSIELCKTTNCSFQNQATNTQMKNGGLGVLGSFLKRLRAGKAKGNSGKFDENVGFEIGFSGSHCDNEVSVCEKSEKRFCLSPEINRLRVSPQSRCSPISSSPVASPCQEIFEAERVEKIHSEEVEEEKEQCSPVSVLDPPFEDDEKEGNENEEDEDDHDNDMECSYALVQRAKEQLLERLIRFEKLAELDPVELERSILEQQEEYECDDDYEDDDEDELTEVEENENKDIYKKSKLGVNRQRLLLTDLIAKEKRKGDGLDERKIAVKRVCKRVDLWEEEETKVNIDKMVKFDFRDENDGWRKNDHGHFEETAIEVEISIFGILVNELMEEFL